MDQALELEAAAAKAAHERGDSQLAIEHWKRCIDLDPAFVPAYWVGGVTLLQAGRLDEADAMLSRGVELEPDNIPLAVEHAKVAIRLKNWPEGIKRWTRLSQRAPEAKEVIDGRLEAEWHIQTYRASERPGEGPSDGDWRKFIKSRPKTAETNLFMNFQSLGDNCEFGLVQRHFQAEPISFLRWCSISLEFLVKGLENGFQGAGDPKTTELTVGAFDEYVLADHANAIIMHTFLFKGQTKESQDELFEKICRRQSYLRRQLLEDLSDAEQIFVFKSLNSTDIEGAKQIHAALRKHGRCNLLFAVEASQQRRSGSVEQISPGLYIGAIQRFCRPGEGWDNIHFDSWLSVCRDVLSQVRASDRISSVLGRMFKRFSN